MAKRKGSGARAALPAWPASPPLTPMATLSELLVTPPWSYSLTEPEGDAREALERFLVGQARTRLADGDLGGPKDLREVHRNVGFAVHIERILADLLGVCAVRNVPAPERLIVATKLVALGAHHVTAAHVLHIRDEPVHHAAALTLARTAIELVARGGWVALGTGSEPRRVVEGGLLGTREQRRAAEISATTCLKAVESEVRQKWRSADPPVRVYQWLCRFTHFDGAVVNRLVQGAGIRADAYAGTAYVAWFAAAVGEILMGQRFAEPPRLPDPPPWR